jgi:hypothetical protein
VLVEPVHGGCAGFGTHASAQHNRVVAVVVQHPVEGFEVARPLSQDQAVSPSPEGIEDVIDDLLVTVFVGCEVAVHGGHAPRR